MKSKFFSSFLNHMAENIFSKYEIQFFPISCTHICVLVQHKVFFLFLNNLEQNQVKQDKETKNKIFLYTQFSTQRSCQGKNPLPVKLLFPKFCGFKNLFQLKRNKKLNHNLKKIVSGNQILTK